MVVLGGRWCIIGWLIREKERMNKYEMVECGWNEDGVVVDMVFVNDVSLLDDVNLEILSGYCGLLNCGLLGDDEVGVLIEEGKLFRNVSEVLGEVFDEVGLGIGYDDKDERFNNEFVVDFEEEYGEKLGVMFNVEYDGGVVVMLNGDWLEMRKDCKKEMEKRGGGGGGGE